jgi:REP element-mobilizing transposase RayT
VTFRGNKREPIFKSDADRQRLLDAMAQARDLYQTRIFLVFLIPDHVHVVMETPRGNLRAFMRRILSTYTVYFNRRLRRGGRLGHVDRSGGNPTTGQVEEPGRTQVRLAQSGDEDRPQPGKSC